MARCGFGRGGIGELMTYDYYEGYGIWRKDWTVTYTIENYARLVLELTLPEYAAARTVYYASIREQVEGYLTSSDAITRHKSDMNEAIAIAYIAVAGIAWHDGGGDITDAVTVAALLKAMIDKEQGYTDGLFERLRLLRAQLQQGETSQQQMTAIHEGQARAEDYSKSLDYWYVLVKLMGMGERELMFGGPSGVESCDECTMLLNTWHKASWYVAHGYVPPRGENLSCHPGGLCEHTLTDRQGRLVSI